MLPDLTASVTRTAFWCSSNKLREARLRWYGHVLRTDNDSICKIGFDLDVPGKRPKGRPRQRWMDTLHADLKAVALQP
ncbi:hypothetical protein ANCDUO_17354 [Ancylostoma duodenale]|uniref:Uncharacterized protein n=1 Tax=Ancylostoma duodenale TaxID=51022 RepID=A0A0C2FVD6_9BILA|nr:hypothetical protein ANCDUO_17354 [Ancylostoma duodenale]